MEYCLPVVNKAGDNTEDLKSSNSKKAYKSVDVQCTIQGMTISAYTVDDCMNTTADQVHYLNYPWNQCVYDSRAQLYAKVLGAYSAAVNTYLHKGALVTAVLATWASSLY